MTKASWLAKLSPRALPLWTAVTLTSLACAASAAPLTDYVGVYATDKGQRLELVVGKNLFAVIDEAKYPLQHLGGDTFKSRSGDTVVFTRNAAGDIDGFTA